MNKKEAVEILIRGGIEPNEARAELRLIIESVLKKTEEDLILEPDFDPSPVLPVLNERIKTRRPIQYILGEAHFMGEKFIVNENVLIPRDDTEILVREAFRAAEKAAAKACTGAGLRAQEVTVKQAVSGAPAQPPAAETTSGEGAAQTAAGAGAGAVKILDIGTGSGVIACALGKLGKEAGLELEIIGVDISTGALNVAIDNMKKLNLTRVVMFRKSDLFSNIRQEEKFDIIVSNPPYIPKKAAENLQKEVQFEPKEALFTEDEDGLYFYKKIIDTAPKFLNPEGKILFEVMKGQSKDVAGLFMAAGFSKIKITPDLSGIERVVSGSI